MSNLNTMILHPILLKPRDNLNMRMSIIHVSTVLYNNLLPCIVVLLKTSCVLLATHSCSWDSNISKQGQVRTNDSVSFSTFSTGPINYACKRTSYSMAMLGPSEHHNALWTMNIDPLSLPINELTCWMPK